MMEGTGVGPQKGELEEASGWAEACGRIKFGWLEGQEESAMRRSGDGMDWIDSVKVGKRAREQTW